MISKQKVIHTVEEYLQDSDMYLISVRITPQNKVMVYIDGDNGVKISDCVKLSKYIEKCYDRSMEDFELEVSSPGVGRPLQVKRQYNKNIGRIIVVKTTGNEKFSGKLVKVEDDGIELEIIDKKNKSKAKKLADSEKKFEFVFFDNIEEAKIKPVF